MIHEKRAVLDHIQSEMKKKEKELEMLKREKAMILEAEGTGEPDTSNEEAIKALKQYIDLITKLLPIIAHSYDITLKDNTNDSAQVKFVPKESFTAKEYTINVEGVAKDSILVALFIWRNTFITCRCFCVKNWEKV